MKQDNYGLTPDQSDLLAYITMFHKEFNLYPTIKEMMSGQINGNQVIKKRNYSYPTFFFFAIFFG